MSEVKPAPSQNGRQATEEHPSALSVMARANGHHQGGVIIGGNNIQNGVLIPQYVVELLAVMGIQLQQGQKDLPSEAVALLKNMGINLPDSIKEIETMVMYDAGTRRIVLPIGMDKKTAAAELTKQWKNEEQLINHRATFEGFNWKDALVAVKRVTENVFGWMNAQNIETWFGPIRPSEIDVVIDVVNGKNITEKAFYGRFAITAWDDATADLSVDGGEVSIKIEGKRKYAGEVTRYFEEIRRHLESASIYRGKSLVVTKDGNERLQYDIIENKGSDKIFLNRAEELQLDQFVLSGLNDPGKRAYLFTGAYGTGKTESAMRVGRVGTARGMSFFYVKQATLFDLLLSQSKKYQPCIIFVEDIDEITSGDERGADINAILNTLDGVQTKGTDITVVFTTNHIDRINSALRRPGRIDLILEFNNPDREAQEKIYRSYFNEQNGSDELDYELILAATPAIQGAVLAEISKRAIKLAEKHGHITTDQVLACIASMSHHIKLMQGEVEGDTPEKQYVDLQRRLFFNADSDLLEKVKKTTDEIRERV